MALYYMLKKMTRVIRDLTVSSENMLRNLEKTHGLIYSQPVLLKLIEKGLSREEAYKVVQTCAMKVWETGKEFKEILKSENQIKKYLSVNEIDLICDLQVRLKNVNYIFKNLNLG
jgi:adenylosuccinate lyase